ncbi:MAG: MaoC family dehydratase [Pseudomonadales bacterium]
MSVSFEELNVGDQLPVLDIDITTKLITGAAIASRDYQDVHRDQDAARALGSPDIFMNILTSNGLVGRYVTDWGGPRSILKKVAIRLGAPNYPGDTMRFSGEVISLNKEENCAELKVIGANKIGEHVIADIKVQLPACATTYC